MRREWQLGTVQLDSAARAFRSALVNSLGEEERPVMIHRALLD